MPRTTSSNRGRPLHRLGLSVGLRVRHRSAARRARRKQQGFRHELRRSLRRLWLTLRELRLPRPWHGFWRWLGAKLAALALLLVALALAAGLVYAIVTAVAKVAGHDGPPLPGFVDKGRTRCDGAGFACDALTSVVSTVIPLLLALAAFVLWRFRRARRRMRKQARENTVAMLQAGEIVDSVVGRDDLCDALQDGLASDDPRPQVLVGGVGAGKTAVLLQLTRALARRGAVPVPIRLRNVGAGEQEVDFLALARERFDLFVRRALWTDGEREKVWSRLRSRGELVVIADGLEEALLDDGDGNRDGEAGRDPERDQRIREAVGRARDDGYPLLIASRPHDALNELDAAIVPLEPLSEEAAVQCIDDGGGTAFDALRRIVEAADIVESPLYLQIAHQLHESGRLDPDGFETRRTDRMRLRVALMSRWIDELLQGRLGGDAAQALSRAERESALLYVAALACCGLASDTLEVQFKLFRKPVRRDRKQQAGDEQRADGPQQRYRAVYPDFWERLREELRAIYAAHGDARPVPQEPTIHVPAGLGVRLGLVEQTAAGVRFPHSVMQAYLGSRVLALALHDDRFIKEAFDAPGRELLLALTMLSRAAPGTLPAPPAGDHDSTSWPAWLVRRLLERARQDSDELFLPTDKRIDLIATAAEIAVAGEAFPAPDPPGQLTPAPAASPVPSPARSAPPARNGWRALAGLRALAGMLLAAVSWLWEALMMPEPAATAASATPLQTTVEPAAAPSSPAAPAAVTAVPLATASALAQAVAQDAKSLWAAEPDLRKCDDPAIQAAKGRLVVRLGDAARRMDAGAAPLYDALREVCCNEASYGVRLAAAQELGSGGAVAYEVLQRLFEQGLPLERRDKDLRRLMRDALRRADGSDSGLAQHLPTERKLLAQMWILPLLVASWDEADTGEECQRARDRLNRCVELAGAMPLSVQSALAQGFKYAANRRPQDRHDHAVARALLAELADRMIRTPGLFWYARLTLLHALCLSWLSTRSWSAREAGAPNVGAVVDRWLGRSGGRRRRHAPEHPFVEAAARLVVRAMKTGRPERCLWIDERGVAEKVGSRPRRAEQPPNGQLWIAPSAGWLVLTSRAQQLVADVLIELNLAERGDVALERQERLEQIDTRELPYCLRDERADHLHPAQAAGTLHAPGDDCKAGCPIRLCPYPAKGQHPYRGELSETFCRNQALLLRRRWRHPVSAGRAPWQSAPRRDLRRFWEAMEARARS
jgi:hypothetical protein